MSTKTVIMSAFLAFLLGVVVIGGMALGYRSDCVRAEAGIKAQYKQNQNNYDNMWKRFKEMAQVPEQYTKDMKTIWSDTMSGRYGEGGSRALMQWIQEQNPQLDPGMYQNIQTAIEAGRVSFAADQTQLLAKKQAYEIVLNENRGAMVGWIFGFPNINLDEYDIVTSAQTDDAFQTKKAEEVKLFGN